MKPITFFFLCLIALSAVTLWPKAGATSFPIGQSSDTINLTLSSITTSNKTSAAVFVESASTHTFQFVTLCTNSVTNIIQASLDNVGWFGIYTNVVSASSTNGAASFIGNRFSYLRSVFTQATASGSTNTVLYLGGRQ